MLLALNISILFQREHLRRLRSGIWRAEQDDAYSAGAGRLGYYRRLRYEQATHQQVILGLQDELKQAARLLMNSLIVWWLQVNP